MMHPDYKMGLAVGLALVGMVGAMFFRRENHSSDETPPPLENIAEIDNEIVDSPRAPYLNVIDDISEDAAGKAKATTPHTARKPAENTAPGFDSTPPAESEEVTLLPEPGAESDPIRATPRRNSVNPDVVPLHNLEWRPSGGKGQAGGKSLAESGESNAGRTGAEGERRKSDASGLRTHTIQPGDTLSRIAEKYLGSPRYYRELYEANRERLRSVDDLPEGVTLVIPNRKPGAPLPPESRENSATSPRTRLIDEDEEDPLRRDGARRDDESKPFKLQFEPVRRRPLPNAGNGEGRQSSRSNSRDEETSPRLMGIEVDDSPEAQEEDDPDESLLQRKRSRSNRD